MKFLPGGCARRTDRASGGTRLAGPGTGHSSSRLVGGGSHLTGAVHDDEQRHDDRARPVRDLVDVEEEERWRQQHDLDRHRRHAVPVVFPEEQLDFREDIGLDGAAQLEDALAGDTMAGSFIGTPAIFMAK